MADEIIPGGETKSPEVVDKSTAEVDPQETKTEAVDKSTSEPEAPVTKTLTVEELQDELKKVRKEAAGYRTKNKELVDSLTAAKTAEEAFKAQLASKDTEITTIKSGIKEAKVKTTFDKVATETGVIDCSAAYRLIDTSLFEYDEADNLKEESIKTAVTKLKEAYPFVFKTGANTDIDAGDKGKQPTKDITDFFRNLN